MSADVGKNPSKEVCAPAFHTVALSSRTLKFMLSMRIECFCDPLCVKNNECCVDYLEICNTTTPTTTTASTTTIATTTTTTTTGTTITLVDFRSDPRTNCRDPRFSYLFTTTANINNTITDTFFNISNQTTTTAPWNYTTTSGKCPGPEKDKGCRYPSRQGNRDFSKPAADCEGANNICSCDWDGGDCCDADLIPETEYLRRKREAEEGGAVMVGRGG